MKPCKRLEIVIEKPMARKAIAALLDAGAPGYTMIDQASGAGDRGSRYADDPTGTSTNCVIILAAETEEQAFELVESVRPLLSRSGGICLVSDAMWVRH